MIQRIIVIALVIVSFTTKSYSQKIETFKEINEVYRKFKQSFDSLDYKLFSEIHSKKLIRIPGGKKIVDYNNYMEKQKVKFEGVKKENATITIYLRFIERINNDSVASDKGVYKYVKNENLPIEKASYGKFHVLMIKENSSWKIVMDYDSSEGKNINENDFNLAKDMNDFDSFIE